MITIDVFNWDKKKTGQIQLNPDIFSADIRTDILSEMVRFQRAKKRQGSHSVKTRGDVRGGGKKPFRQKGTGRARQGSIRSPLLRAGGVSHGPHPRDYSTKLPKKVKKLGMCSVLSYLHSKKLLWVVEDMVSNDGKTKELCLCFKKFGTDRALLVDVEKNSLFYRACRNLPKYQWLPVKGMNVYDFLKYKQAIFTRKSIEAINQMYTTKKSHSKTRRAKDPSTSSTKK